MSKVMGIGEWRELRKERGALFYHEHSDEFKSVIRATMNGRAPGPRDQTLYIVHKDGEIEYSVALVNARPAKVLESYMAYTIEDYGHRWRVREYGARKRWYTVYKEGSVT